MSHESLGIAFQETLSGGFALHATDPERGLEEGALAGSTLAIHNVISAPDLNAFYADPEHTAELVATLDFTPFGQGIQGARGTFNLFKPGERHEVRLMVYRFGFEHEGAAYLFEGKKYIHEGSSIRDLWQESTRLHSKIYQGTDDTGEVVGAGIIQIGVRGVVDMIRSMQITGTDSRVKQAEAAAVFGKFFMGELWDAYRGHAMH